MRRLSWIPERVYRIRRLKPRDLYCLKFSCYVTLSYELSTLFTPYVLLSLYYPLPTQRIRLPMWQICRLAASVFSETVVVPTSDFFSNPLARCDSSFDFPLLTVTAFQISAEKVSLRVLRVFLFLSRELSQINLRLSWDLESVA